MDTWKEIRGVNAGYLAELYDRYLENPALVDAATRAFFQQATPPAETAGIRQDSHIQKIVGAVNLAESIRKFGHLDARIDPLGSEPPGDPSLRAENYGLTEEDLLQLPASLLAAPLAPDAANAF
jgi:2-oxoglutarate dehydrogenase E1 component